MEMRIDPDQIKKRRKQRAWSQEHLAAVSGLGYRTVQRIETEGSASYDSARALASVLECQVNDLLPEHKSQPDMPASPVMKPENRPWYQRTLSILATSIALGILTVIVMLPKFAIAEQVQMDVELNLEDGENDPVYISYKSMLMNPDKELEINVDDLKFLLYAELQENRDILLSVMIYRAIDEDYELLSTPKVLTIDKQEAVMRVGNGERNIYTMKMLPSIQ